MLQKIFSVAVVVVLIQTACLSHLNAQSPTQQKSQAVQFKENIARWGVGKKVTVKMIDGNSFMGPISQIATNALDLNVMGQGRLTLSGLTPNTYGGRTTVFTRGATGFAVAQVPWDREASYRLSVAVWRALMAEHFPGTEWLRVRRDTVDALGRYKHARGLTTWDDVVNALLADASALDGEAGP